MSDKFNLLDDLRKIHATFAYLSGLVATGESSLQPKLTMIFGTLMDAFCLLVNGSWVGDDNLTEKEVLEKLSMIAGILDFDGGVQMEDIRRIEVNGEKEEEE